MKPKCLAVLLIAALFPAWREVQPSELAVILLCGFIVGACGLLWRVVIAKRHFNPIILDLRSPSSVPARHPLKTTGIVPGLPSISLILCARRLPQIYAAIVERVSVYMVRAFSRSRNNGMHKNGFSAQVPLRVELPAGRMLPGTPVRLRQRLKVRGVHDGDVAIGKGDKANCGIGWLNYWLPGFPGKHGLNFIAVSLIILAILTIPGASGQGQNFPGNTSSSSSPNASTIYAWDPKYNLPQPAKWVCDATFVSGSATVTTPVTDRPFLSTDSFAVVVGGAALCGGQPQTTITTLTPANATATFVSAHTITLSGNALASCTPTGNQGGCALFWGPDHTAAIQAAFNDAANNCGTLVLPAGGLIFNAVVNNSTSLCPLVTGANGEPSAVTVKGQGPWSTMLLFTPNVSFASAMFGTVSGGINVSLHDFGVASFTQAGAGLAGQSGFFLFFNSNMYNVWFLDFFPSNANSFRAVSIAGVVDAVTSFHDNELLNSGFIGLNVTGNCVNIFNNWVQGQTRTMAITAGTGSCGINTWDNQFTFCGTQGCVNSSSNGSQWFSDNDTFKPTGASVPAIDIQSTFGVFMHNAHITNNPSTTSPALSVSAGQTVVIDGESSAISTGTGTGNGITNAGNLTLRNVSVASAGGVGLNNSGTVTFKEGNAIANGITNTGTFQGQRGNGVETGACTGVVTSATTVGLFPLGQLTTSTCTTATVGLGQVMSKAGTVYALYCTATAGNQATSACTALKNGVAQTMTCSLNALAACTDGTTGHTFTYVAGDILSVEAIAGTADTLANVKGLLVTN